MSLHPNPVRFELVENRLPDGRIAVLHKLERSMLLEANGGFEA